MVPFEDGPQITGSWMEMQEWPPRCFRNLYHPAPAPMRQGLWWSTVSSRKKKRKRRLRQNAVSSRRFGHKCSSFVIVERRLQ